MQRTKHRYMTRASVLLAAALAVTACAAPGSGGEGDAADADGGTEQDAAAGDATAEGELTEPVTDEDVEALGDVTLRILADAGEEQTLEVLIPEFEERYPNVTVEADIRSWDDIVATGVNTMTGSNPPDLAQGTQGHAVDGALVETGAIRPIDDIAAAYGWEEQFGSTALDEMRWTSDGSQFGDGELYGISPVVSMVGVYYNRAMLDDLGLEVPSDPESFDQALQAASDAGEQPILLGNAGQGPGMHAFGLIHGTTVEPQEVRDWISGEPGTTFDTEDSVAAAERIQEWAAAGYFEDGVNSVDEDDAVARFTDGDALFLPGGTWLMPAFEGVEDEFGFFAMPPGSSGVHAAPGSLGMGWHISTETELLPAAVAFMSMLHTEEYAQVLAELGRVPIIVEGLDAPDPLFEEAAQASATILEEGGNMHSYDWVSGTMFQTIGGGVQELIAGRTTPEDFAATVQSDWESSVEAEG
jgi:raffinose/stachyose/melibiose transport system substrate-binding protein